jgi:sigma-54 specific flagellar transcriptional regulator A
MNNDTIYVIDDNKERCDKLHTLFRFIGKPVEFFSFATSLIKVNPTPHVIILGSSISTQDTLNQLGSLIQNFSQVPFLVLDTQLTTTQCADHNVIACLSLPFSYSQLLDVLHRCQIARETLKSLPLSQQKTPLFRSLVGNSEGIRGIRKLIGQVANTDASVLVLGESGTGKEVVARTIHALSARAMKPFIPINCGAIPGELLESELFGHEKGAFTGAITSRQGRFELANGGTLFLDEIGDMPLAMQVKLLRVLQEQSFERVGANKSISVNVRIIAATHRNLEQAIQEGKFREDLFYRLNVFPIEMPPLRERRDDVPLLFHELISRFEQSKRPIVHLLPDALESLSQYNWPGNVRELANLVERLSILYPNGIVDKNDLPRRFQGEPIPASNEFGSSVNERAALLGIMQDPIVVNEGIDLKEHLVKTELTLITQALEEADWVVAHAASYLNMRRTTLVEKMRKYGLTRPEKMER